MISALPEERYIPEPNSGCWLWLGATRSGYGTIVSRTEPNRYAHRVSYEQHVGPIPKGGVIRHSCDTPICVNPDHLFLGTHADNVTDKTEKGRAAKKLTEAKVREIRADNRTQREIAKDYGVTRQMIGYIKRNQFWKWSK